jgi:hypothetical protein
MVIAEYF